MKQIKFIILLVFTCLSYWSFGQTPQIYVFESTAAFMAEKKDLQDNPVWEDLPVMKGIIVYLDLDHDKLNIQNKKTNNILLQYHIAYTYPEYKKDGLTKEEYACIDQDFKKCDVQLLFFKGTDNKDWIQLYITKEKLYRLDLKFATE